MQHAHPMAILIQSLLMVEDLIITESVIGPWCRVIVEIFTYVVFRKLVYLLSGC